MSITDELRRHIYEWATAGEEMRLALAIADSIDEDYAKARDKAYNEGVYDAIDADKNAMGYVKLPVDADGVPIHFGDVMDGTCPSGKHVSGTVSAIGDGVFWLSNVQFSLKPDYMHHYREPTVEDVLREFAYGLGVPVADSYVAATAAKLRLAEEDE